MQKKIKIFLIITLIIFLIIFILFFLEYRKIQKNQQLEESELTQDFFIDYEVSLSGAIKKQYDCLKNSHTVACPPEYRPNTICIDQEQKEQCTNEFNQAIYTHLKIPNHEEYLIKYNSLPPEIKQKGKCITDCSFLIPNQNKTFIEYNCLQNC